MHNKYYVHFFLSWWCNALAGNLALIIQNSELTSTSSFGEICISLNVKYVGLSSEVGWLAIPFSFCAHAIRPFNISSTSCIAFHLPFAGFFFVCLLFTWACCSLLIYVPNLTYLGIIVFYVFFHAILVCKWECKSILLLLSTCTYPALKL